MWAELENKWVLNKKKKKKDKEKILKASREKQLATHKGTPSKTNSRNSVGQKGVTQYIQSAERKKLPTNNTLPGKVTAQSERVHHY